MTSIHRALAIVLSLDLVVGAVCVALILDLRAHAAVQDTVGVNAFGFRGTARIHKIPGERRVVVVGGTAAFAPGVPAEQTFVATLGRFVNQRWRKNYQHFTSVVNAAEVGAGAGSYTTAIRRYAFLDPDVVMIYDGYDDVAGQAAGGGREASALFRRTGYYFVLPRLVSGSPPWTLPDGMFTPNVDPDPGGYIAAMSAAVESILDRATVAVVVTPPYVSTAHEAQQQALASALQARFGGDRRFAYVNLGRAVDLRRPASSPDGVRLTLRGQEQVAEALTDVMLAKVEIR